MHVASRRYTLATNGSQSLTLSRPEGLAIVALCFAVVDYRLHDLHDDGHGTLLTNARIL